MMIRVYATADLHGKQDRIERLQNNLSILKPDLLICGHIHEDSGMTMIGRTHVLNCAFNRHGSGTLILFQDGRFIDFKMIP
jgi:Icc-related predicted phosphoesterase